MDKLQEELKTKMIDNDLSLKMQKEAVKDYIESENDIFTSIVTNFNKEIKKIKKFTFDEDQVTVTFISKVEKQIKYLDMTSEEKKELSKQADFETGEETITLQNVDGKWKVVYADLQYRDYSEGFIQQTIAF